jgi:hypothetical protein
VRARSGDPGAAGRAPYSCRCSSCSELPPRAQRFIRGRQESSGATCARRLAWRSIRRQSGLRGGLVAASASLSFPSRTGRTSSRSADARHAGSTDQAARRTRRTTTRAHVFPRHCGPHWIGEQARGSFVPESHTRSPGCWDFVTLP